ncbi:MULTISPECIES: nuclear transport factor 2 family protein [unclassified Variovorax]|uniref:nuclear transport factor 2 family protein n=1 Tax=unclassified Variovorax TaxID=663243 RepID=UPI001BD29478|nr:MULTISPECIES: nuclear transport factor 2 family protein [unclassified Variovorax]
MQAAADTNESLIRVIVQSHNDARCAAMLERDFTALETLLDDALTYTHSTGVTESKAQYLDALRTGRVKYLGLKRELDHFHAWGTCAVMQGRLGVEAEVDGQPYGTRALFTSTWVRQEGKWRMAAWASTREKAEAST